MTDIELKMKCLEFAIQSGSTEPKAFAKDLFDWVKESLPEKEGGFTKLITEEMVKLKNND